ncbi:uncharacterized protein LOC131928583 [Physella acuta]|uniref:uncharacterized protein LOC131928583 n=1 Tax=Physella acuta TaxID=109671 RepID=UPI0027DC7586|nr:uncharacterized protein LOC131928583 [Physella acuta]
MKAVVLLVLLAISFVLLSGAPRDGLTLLQELGVCQDVCSPDPADTSLPKCGPGMMCTNIPGCGHTCMVYNWILLSAAPRDLLTLLQELGVCHDTCSPDPADTSLPKCVAGMQCTYTPDCGHSCTYISWVFG